MEFLFLNFVLAHDDIIYNELKKPEEEKVVLPLDEDRPGMGQFYGLRCDRYFANVTVRDEHFKTKRHKKRFMEGVRLPVFKSTKGLDSVLVVNEEAYHNCNKTNPKEALEDGNSIFKFKRLGLFFFISGHDEKCRNGQKLIIIVMAVSHHDHVVRSTNTAPTPALVVVAMAPSAMLQGFDGHGIRKLSSKVSNLGGLLCTEVTNDTSEGHEDIVVIGIVSREGYFEDAAELYFKANVSITGYSKKKKGKEKDQDHHHHNENEYESEHELEDEDEHEIEEEDEFELEDEKPTKSSWMTKTNEINVLMF
ncbi:early nodulin-like protein 14 [Tanacetum coccineum]